MHTNTKYQYQYFSACRLNNRKMKQNGTGTGKGLEQSKQMILNAGCILRYPQWALITN